MTKAYYIKKAKAFFVENEIQATQQAIENLAAMLFGYALAGELIHEIEAAGGLVKWSEEKSK
jgi:hypothetical protein